MTSLNTIGREDGAKQDAEMLPAALRLIASVFEREVSRELLTGLRERRADISTALGGDPLARLDLQDEDAVIEALTVEYCRLFIGPRGHMPPVESVALGEGRFWGPATEAVSEFYRNAGFVRDSDASVLPDHISMQLDFLATLEEQGRKEPAKDFAQEHVLRWLPVLVKHIADNTALPFYLVWARGLQTILEELYAEEAQQCLE